MNEGNMKKNVNDRPETPKPEIQPAPDQPTNNQEQIQGLPPYRKVLIGTPTIDGKVEAAYVASLLDAKQYLATQNIDLFPIFMAYDALIQRARNDIIQLAVDSDVDDIVFIDSDIGWKPEQLIRLLSHNVDLVGGTYRRRTDISEMYVLKIREIDKGINPNKDELLEVEGLGCGFMRMTRRCYRLLWEISEKYEDNSGKRNKMVFNLSIRDGIFTSEDISLCYKWQDLEEKVWLDPYITCTHTGMKVYEGDFMQWIKSLDLQKNVVRPLTGSDLL